MIVSAKRSYRKGRVHQPVFSLFQMSLSWIGSFVGIFLLAHLSVDSSYPLIAAPMGATSVLVFGVPHSPLAQPRNVIGGNLIGTLVSAALVRSFGNEPWVMAMAVSSTILLMKSSRTVHPPSGAVALVGVMSEVSWDFVIAPVLAGSVVIVLWTYLFNNVASGRSHPMHWL